VLQWKQFCDFKASVYCLTFLTSPQKCQKTHHINDAQKRSRQSTESKCTFRALKVNVGQALGITSQMSWRFTIFPTLTEITSDFFFSCFTRDAATTRWKQPSKFGTFNGLLRQRCSYLHPQLGEQLFNLRSQLAKTWGLPLSIFIVNTHFATSTTSHYITRKVKYLNSPRLRELQLLCAWLMK